MKKTFEQPRVKIVTYHSGLLMASAIIGVDNGDVDDPEEICAPHRYRGPFD